MLRFLTAHVFAAAAALVVVYESCGAVPVGENIIANPMLAPGDGGWPPEWDLSYECRIGVNTFFHKQPGGETQFSARFAACGDMPQTLILRQYGITLSPKGKYRISAEVRTKNLRSRSAGLLVLDEGWRNPHGIAEIPADTEWTRLSAEIKATPSPESVYSVAFYARNIEAGEIEMRSCRLEAIDRVAADGAERTKVVQMLSRPRLVPWTSLDSIPSETRTLEFTYFGKMPTGADAGEWALALSTGNSPGDKARVPLSGRRIKAVLPGIAKSGKLDAQIVRQNGSQIFVSETFRFSVRPSPPAVSGRRLNNLVRELVSKSVKKGEDVSFPMPRDGWILISSESGGESFKRLPSGVHRVSAERDGRLTVRMIPEIVSYPFCAPPVVAENPPRTAEGILDRMLATATTHNGGDASPGAFSRLRRNNGLWLDNLVSRDLESDEDLAARLFAASGMTDAVHDGVTCDEQAFDRIFHLERYAAGLKKFNAAYDGGRLVHTWVIARAIPMHSGADEEFMAAAAAASHGRGRILLECYGLTRPDEDSARVYLSDFAVRTHRECKRRYPPFARSSGIILGPFNQSPVITTRLHPQVDAKYYLDMQFNMLANNPEFVDLPCTGVWGMQYTDDEMYRWTLRLLRHYCIDGSSEMLSAEYGFSYAPGILDNGDFAAGLAGWSASGCVETECVEGFARDSEGRWKDDIGIGDTFAVLKRTGPEAPSLSRRLTGTQPGRMYCLEACAFDAEDARKGRNNPKKSALKILIPGAQVRDDLSWVHVDRRRNGKRTRGARVNLMHTVFVAGEEPPTVVFDAANCAQGEEVGVNFVGVWPYFNKE